MLPEVLTRAVVVATELLLELSSGAMIEVALARPHLGTCFPQHAAHLANSRACVCVYLLVVASPVA